jgi:hypothetical protein
LKAWKIQKFYFHQKKTEIIGFQSARLSSEKVSFLLKAIHDMHQYSLYEQLGISKYNKPNDLGHSISLNKDGSSITIGHEPMCFRPSFAM